jgi:tetraacyldisaccharide 4'-kinase
LGNPQAFRRTLVQLGVDLAGWEEFDDHHRYRASEVKRLAQVFKHEDADAMVTTEKDAVNLPETVEDLPVYYLRIAMQIDREDEVVWAKVR